MSNVNTEYVLISKSEIDLKGAEVKLYSKEVEELIEYQDVFIKFLKKSRLSYQIELCKWTFRWKEEELYRSIKTVDEIINSIKSAEDAFKTHKTED